MGLDDEYEIHSVSEWHPRTVERGAGMRAFVVLMAVLFALVLGAPANAIIGGTPDGSGHPNVGALWIHASDGNIWWCSGTLVSPTVVVTAARCAGGEFPIDRVQVTCDPQLNTSPSGELLNPSIDGVARFDPRYVQPPPNHGASGFVAVSQYDFGVVVLDRPANQVFPGTVPAPLPSLGVLDAFATGTRNRFFTSVGYGLTRPAHRTRMT